MRRWMLGLLIFLFLSLSVFSLILGRKLQQVAKTHRSFLKTPTVTVTLVPSITQEPTGKAHDDKVYDVNPNKLH